MESFLNKIDQQMGVAIVGFAAYRDEDGKLNTFKFVAPSLKHTFHLISNSSAASAQRTPERTHLLKHTLRILGDSFMNGEIGLQTKV